MVVLLPSLKLPPRSSISFVSFFTPFLPPFLPRAQAQPHQYLQQCADDKIMKFRAGLMAKDLSLLNGNSSSLPSSIPLSLPHPPSPSPHHTTQGVAQCFEKIGPSCLIYLSERSIKFASPKLGSDEVRVFSEIEQVRRGEGGKEGRRAWMMKENGDRERR